MKPRPETKVLVGDCRERLRELPEASVHCCVTSPPYFSQRDYGTGEWEGGDPECDHEKIPARGGRGGSGSPGKQRSGVFPSEFCADVCGKCGARRVDKQIGLERSPDCLGWATGSPCGECYVCTMVSVFREVRRVLRDDATVFLNLGDKYSSGGRKDMGPQQGKQQTNRGSLGMSRADDGMGPKQLLGIPWRVALALQADGWTLRSDVIWHKPNAMPGSQGDRPTTNHEYLFLLAKRPSYYYDGEAIKERATAESVARYDRGRAEGHKYAGGGPVKQTLADSLEHMRGNNSRTRRSVWTVPVASEKESHFAVFPERLILPCILAGTSERGVCPACGAPWRRLVETERTATRPGKDTKTTGDGEREGNRDPQRHVCESRTVGWEPGCSCDAGEPIPATVLDPFGGSGTTAAAALKKGRSAILCELNPDYAAIIERKLKRARTRAGFML